MPFSQKDKKDVRVIWRIIFEVIKAEINLRKEISIWSIPAGGNSSVLLHRSWHVPITEFHSQNVELEPDFARFDNGYVMFEDPDLENAIEAEIGKDIEVFNVTNPNLGENLGIVAEINFFDITPVDFPILYYPQHMSDEKKHIAFRLSHIGGVSRVKRYNPMWHVQGKTLNPGVHYGVSTHNLWHRLTVRQMELSDVPGRPSPGSGSGRIGRFEFLADGIPLGDVQAGQPGGSFQIKSEKKRCYIGGFRNGREVIGLTGGIRRVVFDPNDSCPTCRG